MPVYQPGVDSVAKQGDTPLTGDVTVSAGANVTLTQVGQNIEIAASGGAGSPGPQGSPGPAVFLEAESIEGEPGPPGAPGATGAAGATGDTGPAGPAIFLVGEEGADGEPGAPGVAGAAGAAGATGAQGPVGPAVFLAAEAEEGPMGHPGTTSHHLLNNIGADDHHDEAHEIPVSVPATADSFDRADSTTTMGTPDVGNAWTALEGTWGISSNNAYAATIVGADLDSVVSDSGLADCDVEVTFSTLGTDMRLAFRFTDVNNGWIIDAVGGSYLLYDLQAGVYNLRATGVTTPTTGDVVRARLEGNQIKGYVNGVLQFTFTSSFNLTATKHGLGVGAGAGTSRWNDYSVNALTVNPHTASGLTRGHVLQATSATVAQFGAIKQDMVPAPPVFFPDEPDEGPMGPPGPAGAAGATGATGATGAPGAPIFLPGDDGEDGMVGPPGATGPQGPAGGGGGSVTVVEQSLTEGWRGSFTITDAAITASSKITIAQAPGPYTGKGTLADEAEMDPLWCVAAPASGQATVYWRTHAMLAHDFSDVRGTQPVASANTQHGDPFRAALIQRVVGRVRGNVKFMYSVAS